MKYTQRTLLPLIAVAVTLSAFTATAKPKDGTPNGRPFEELRAQIAALEARLAELEGGGDLSDSVIPSDAGLLLVDEIGTRILSPGDLEGANVPPGPATLFWGPTDDCSIGIDPPGGLSGLIERDPVGFRLMGPDGQGCRLIFGPTMDCTVEVDPNGPDGLLLRDPNGVRVLSPDPERGAALRFGPSDECSLRIDPPGGLTGLIESDPNGLRLLGPGGEGCILTFGPTDECRIFVDADPEIQGLNFSDPFGFFFNNDIFVQGSVNEASSRDFKANVQPIEKPLDIINQLQGVSFDWKAEFGGKAGIGFIAEEVAEVLPQLVTMNEDGRSAKGMNYSNLVAVAVEGIKAQQSEIETLRSDNAALRERLNTMEAQMAVILEGLKEASKE